MGSRGLVDKGGGLWILVGALDGDVVNFDTLDVLPFFGRFRLCCLMNVSVVDYCANLLPFLNAEPHVYIFLISFV